MCELCRVVVSSRLDLPTQIIIFSKQKQVCVFVCLSLSLCVCVCVCVCVCLQHILCAYTHIVVVHTHIRGGGGGRKAPGLTHAAS